MLVRTLLVVSDRNLVQSGFLQMRTSLASITRPLGTRPRATVNSAVRCMSISLPSSWGQLPRGGGKENSQQLQAPFHQLLFSKEKSLFQGSQHKTQGSPTTGCLAIPQQVTVATAWNKLTGWLGPGGLSVSGALCALVHE